MIKEIRLLVGLPGSGKSTLGEKLAKDSLTVFIDDFSMLTKDAKVYLDTKDFKSIETLIIADCPFCISEVREKAKEVLYEKFQGATISEIFFENDPVKCLKNIKRRQLKGDTRSVENYLLELAKIYRPEKSAIAIND